MRLETGSDASQTRTKSAKARQAKIYAEERYWELLYSSTSAVTGVELTLGQTCLLISVEVNVNESLVEGFDDML